MFMSNDYEEIKSNEEDFEEVTSETEEITEEEKETSDVDESQEAETEEECSKKQKKGWKKELLEWIQSLLVAVVVALLIVNFVFTLVRVSGASMEPTLQNNNSLFVLRLGYEPKNGDIIVFKPIGDPKKYYIKRVIATEGQEVDIRDGKVYVDGEELSEDYIQGTTYDRYNSTYPKIVPEDCVFALGDNRENSRDSRDMTGVGMVKEKDIVGKAWFRLFPFNKIGGLYD